MVFNYKAPALAQGRLPKFLIADLVQTQQEIRGYHAWAEAGTRRGCLRSRRERSALEIIAVRRARAASKQTQVRPTQGSAAAADPFRISHQAAFLHRLSAFDNFDVGGLVRAAGVGH